MRMLKPGGRSGLVLPDGTLFGEGVKTRIKEALLRDCNLHTIVRLPNGVFNPYTGIRTNLLFFTKGEQTKEIWYYEHPYPPGAKSYNKGKPIRIEEFDVEKKWWKKRVETEQAWRTHRPNQSQRLQPRPKKSQLPRRRRRSPHPRIRKTPLQNPRNPRFPQKGTRECFKVNQLTKPMKLSLKSKLFLKFEKNLVAAGATKANTRLR